MGLCLIGTNGYIISAIIVSTGLLHWLAKSGYNSEHNENHKFH